jgi:hypothetical protein
MLKENRQVLTKADFKNRFIARMSEIRGQYEPYFEFTATAAWEMYKEDPDDLTPEEHAEEEISEWGRE